jgi:hypothetical protein
MHLVYLSLMDLNSAQMKKIFDPCVNRTLELIDGQVMDMMKNAKVKPKVIESCSSLYLNPKLISYSDDSSCRRLWPQYLPFQQNFRICSREGNCDANAR